MVNRKKKDEAAAQLENQEFHYRHQARPPEPTVIYRVGDAVHYGARDDCRVEAVEDDGRKITITYHDRGEAHGRPFDNQRRLPLVVSWLELLPVGIQEDTTFGRDEWRLASYSQMLLSSLLHIAYFRGVKDNPDYQRGYVWTQEDKVRLLASIFDGADIGKFLLMEYPHPENRLEVIDGKQRLRAIMDFREGRLAYRGKTWFQLSARDRYLFEDRMVQIATLRREVVKDSDVLWLFLSINRGGVPQTEEHIAHVREVYEEALRREAIK